MASVCLRSISKTYSGRKVVDNVDLQIESGEFIVFLGPSGCGKTTTLRMIAGFIDPTEGQILIDGDDVTSLSTRKRGLGMVFQNYALFPNMTVASNIGFGLRQRNVDRRQIAGRVEELLTIIHMEGKGSSYPDELSGGQQQRVALARALAFSPKLLLMDEPLGALDLKLRESLQRDFGITTILVTHDQHEAMSLADRVVLMADGKIQQIGSPSELYEKPANMFVAEFIGKNNVISGVPCSTGLNDCRLRLEDGSEIDIGVPLPSDLGRETRLSIRPEYIEFARLHEPIGKNAIDAVVERRRFLGNVVQYFVRLPWGQVLLVERSGSAETVVEGEAVRIFWQPHRAIAFSADHARQL
jgi:putative spermidine/putrescine transport system ATP-binding protein